MKSVIATLAFASTVIAAVANNTTPASVAASTGFACNPAHSYPGGASCISTAGTLSLVSPSAASTGFACNPAHSYPGGASCISTAGSLTLVTPTAAPTGAPSNGTNCDAAYDACRGAPDANFAYCASQYAGCLGYNPFNGNGTAPAVSGHDVTVTAIVSSFTTVCPSPTTLTYNSKTYTVTSATTLTITDCPCTVTTPVKSLPPVPTVTAIVSSFTTVCPSPTTLTVNSKTYTVTSATTLTITHCPGGCTITTPRVSIPATTSAPVTTLPKPVPSGVLPPPPAKNTTTYTVSTQTYVTYCPTPTTLTVESKTYTISTPTSITLTTAITHSVTIPVVSTGVLPPPGGKPSSVSVGKPSGTTSGVIAYSGAADRVLAGGALFAAALGGALIL